MNREIQKNRKTLAIGEIKIPYKKQFLKQITDGKYGSKTYNGLINKRKNGSSKSDNLFINKKYPTANDGIEKFNISAPSKKHIINNLDFATEMDGNDINPSNTESIIELMDENTNQFIQPKNISSSPSENKNYDQITNYYDNRLEELQKRIEKMSAEIDKFRNTQKIIIKVINKLSKASISYQTDQINKTN